MIYIHEYKTRDCNWGSALRRVLLCTRIHSYYFDKSRSSTVLIGRLVRRRLHGFFSLAFARRYKPYRKYNITIQILCTHVYIIYCVYTIAVLSINILYIIYQKCLCTRVARCSLEFILLYYTHTHIHLPTYLRYNKRI